MKICLFTLGVIYSLSITLPANAWDYPTSVDVDWIEFNHSSSNNSVDIRVNYSTNITEPEWDNGGSTNEKIAYVKNQSVKVQARFVIQGQSIYSLKVGASSSGFGDLDYEWVLFEDNEGQAYFDCDASVPGTVDIRSFRWDWDYIGVNGDVFVGQPPEYYGPKAIETTGTHTYYTLLGTPQSPMTEPWTVVLNYACDWAANQSTESGVATKITENAYTVFGNSHTYNGYYTKAVPPTFYLTDFLNVNRADCQDMSAIVQVFTKAVGGTNITALRIEGAFAYKSILPVGASQWQTGTWNFHQVGWLLSKVYDACLKLANPVRIPVDENINNEYKPDLFDSGDWEADTSINYTTVY